jgi:hypothetical protein
MIEPHSINFFDLIVDVYKYEKPYIVFAIDNSDSNAMIFKFDTKKEFEKYFEIEKHPYYPGNCVVPKTILNYYGTAVECVVWEKEYYIDRNFLYCIINGQILR